jgi:hypothetical protein
MDGAGYFGSGLADTIAPWAPQDPVVKLLESFV